MEDEVTHVLILVHSEYLDVWTASHRLGNGIRPRVIPLEFGSVVFTEQVAYRGAIIGAILNVDSMKERSRKVKSAIQLAANESSEFNLLSECRWEEHEQS